MCLADWSTHGEQTGGYYFCKKYSSASRASVDAEIVKGKQDLERFEYYATRFYDYKSAASAVEGIKTRFLEDKARILKNPSQPSYLEVLEERLQALEVLRQCRSVLAYSYVFGYYLPDAAKGKALFGLNQATLEVTTSNLYEAIIEKPEKVDLVAFKTRVRVTKNYLRKLEESIESGLGMDDLRELRDDYKAKVTWAWQKGNEWVKYKDDEMLKIEKGYQDFKDGKGTNVLELDIQHDGDPNSSNSIAGQKFRIDYVSMRELPVSGWGYKNLKRNRDFFG